MRASYYDLYKIDKHWLVGYVKLHSLTQDIPPLRVKKPFGLRLEQPYLFARIMPINFSYHIVGPTLQLSKIESQHLQNTIEKEFEHQQKRYNHPSKAAFLKINAYHLYETVQQNRLVFHLTQELSKTVVFDPKIIAYNCKKQLDKIFDNTSDTPLRSWEVSPDSHYEPLLTTHHLYASTHRLTLYSFIQNQRDKIQDEIEREFAEYIDLPAQVNPISADEIYRTLRHLLT